MASSSSLSLIKERPLLMWKYIKHKGKVHPITCHEDTDGEQSYSSALSITSALDGVGWLMPHLCYFTPGNGPVAIVYGNTICYTNENPTLLQLSMEQAYCIIPCSRTLLTLSLLLLCNSKQTNKQHYCLQFVKALMSILISGKKVLQSTLHNVFQTCQ